MLIRCAVCDVDMCSKCDEYRIEDTPDGLEYICPNCYADAVADHDKMHPRNVWRDK